MKLARVLLLLALSPVAAACGDAAVTTAALDDVTVEVTFFKTADTWTALVEPDKQPEFAGVKGDVACAWLDEESSLAIDYAGLDSGDFTLAATLIDGSDQLPFFTWKAKLAKGTPKALLTGAGLDAAATKRLSDILKRADTRFSVRYDFAAPGATGAVKFINVLKLRVATPQGTCPAGS